MEETTSSTFNPRVGTPLIVVSYRDDWARLLHGVLESTDPWRVEIPCEDPEECLLIDKVLVLTAMRDPQWRAQAVAIQAHIEPGKVCVTLQTEPWEMVDRRRAARVAIEVPADLRIVEDKQSVPHFETIAGHTTDLSVGGAWINLDTPLPEGTLVEFCSSTRSGEIVRSLAMVVHTNRGRTGIGIEFLNFIGDGQKHLADFLAQAA